MSTTELVTAEKILSDLREKFGIEDETWVSSYAKTAQSKNITIQEWNRVVKKVSANSSSTEALYTALEDSLALFGNLEEKVNKFDDRISTNKTAIEDEAKRATAKENELNNKIELETTRAEGAENALSGRVDTNATNISTNTNNISKNANDIEDIIKAISDLEDFDTTHELEFKAFVEAVNDLLDMSDTDLDEYREVLALIKSNRDSLQHLGTNKIDKSKIADNLKTALADHVLSANQGVVLKNLITTLESALNTEVTNRESAVTSEENARKSAITEEANARLLADATHTAGIAALKTRLDSLSLPLVQHSLYEHSVVLLGSGASGVYPQATLRLTVLNASDVPLTAADVISHLNSKTDVGQIVKTFSGFVEYESSPGATASILISTAITRVTPSTATVCVDYYDSTGTETSIELDASAIVYDSVSIVADVAEGGSGNGLAIIECLELPTENISTTHFYRTPNGRVNWNDGTYWHYVPEDKLDYIAEPTTVILEKTEDTPYIQESDGYGFWYRVSDRYVQSHHLTNGIVKGAFYNDGTTDTTIPSYSISHVIEQRDIVVLEGGYCIFINGERVIHVVSDYEAYALASRVSLNANGVYFRYYDREFVAGHKTYSIDSLSYSAYAISDTALEQSSTFKKAIDEASKAHLKGWDTYNEGAAMRKRGSLGVYGREQTHEESRLVSDGLELSDVEGMHTYYKKGSIHNEVYNVDDIANPKYYTYGLPQKSGIIALLSDITGGSGNTYFVGTLAEYEAQKDTIAVGALIIITDEGDEESAILGQAILGKMILGKGA